MNLLSFIALSLLALASFSAANCPVQTFANANWPSTAVSKTATGTCLAGYSGTPTRKCNTGNVWATNVMNGCIKRTCAAKTEAFATWPAASAGDMKVGTCVTGYGGRVTRTCTLNGVWSAITGTCARCLAENYGRVNWTTTQAQGWAYGKCEVGFYGTPRRWCDIGGVWQTYIWDACQRANCSAANLDNAKWPSTNTNDWATGVCNTGYVGNPVRRCLATGTFGAVMTGNCLPISTCKGETYGRVVWPDTTSGQYGAGQCQTGYEGAPLRLCKFDGTWDSTISSPCTQKVCKAEQVGNVMFSNTLSGATAAGSCVAGTSATNGTPSRLCNQDGTWSSSISGSCA